MGQFYLYRHVRPDLNLPFYIGIGKKYKVPYTPCMEKSEFRRAFDCQARRSDMWRLALIYKGKKRTKEVCEKISASKIGKPRSEETKVKMGATRKSRNLKWSEECRIKNCLKIEQYDANGTLVSNFVGIGVSASSIQLALNTNKLYKGYIWMSV